MLLLPGITEGFKSRRDGSYAVTIGFNELTPERIAELSKSINRWVWFAMQIDEFREKDLDVLKSVHAEFDFSDFGKPPSQRLRGVLYRMWEQDNEGYKDSNLHYIAHMEKIINHYKKKLP